MDKTIPSPRIAVRILKIKEYFIILFYLTALPNIVQDSKK